MVAQASAEKSQALSAFFPCFTDDDDKQGVSVSAGKALHGLAFLPEEAAKQEVSEEIRPSLFSR